MRDEVETRRATASAQGALPPPSAPSRRRSHLANTALTTADPNPRSPAKRIEPDSLMARPRHVTRCEWDRPRAPGGTTPTTAVASLSDRVDSMAGPYQP